MKAVADTSALLSLEYMGVLDEAVGIADIYTTISVKGELNEIAEFRDEKSGIAKKILKHVQEGKIQCIDIKGEQRSNVPILNQCFALCISGKIPNLLTDDADAAYLVGRTASLKGIRMRMCVALLMELVRSEKLGRSFARKKLDSLIDKRSWEGGILEVLGRKYLEEGDW